jgi:hypothetical protein
MGSSTSSTVLNGTSVKATTKLITPILDCVADTTAGTTALSIGSSVVNGNIVIGAALGVGDIIVGGAQTTGGTVTIGSTNTATTNSGTLTSTGLITANAGLTLGSGQGIACGTTSYAPTSSQIGYYLTASVTAIAAPSTLTTFQTTSALAIGIYWICFSGYFNAFTANTGYFVPTIGTTNVTSTIGTYQLGGNSGANVGYSYSGIIKVTAASGTVTFSGIWNGATAVLASGSYSLVRIA